MTRKSALPAFIAAILTACSSPNGDTPSLATRAGEGADPRIPIERPLNDRPADPAVLARLEALVGQARGGEPRFEAAIAAARRAAESAGPPQSESWIVAQEALSGAVEARGAAAIALGSIDALGATLLAEQGGIAPSEFKAIEEAAALVGAIDRRQSAAIAVIQGRLGGD